MKVVASSSTGLACFNADFWPPVAPIACRPQANSCVTEIGGLSSELRASKWPVNDDVNGSEKMGPTTTEAAWLNRVLHFAIADLLDWSMK